MVLPTTPDATASSAVLCELGPLGVETPRGWAPVHGARTQAVLAALTFGARSGVGTEELMEMVWPSPQQPATARQSLANIVLRLRNVFGSSFIESTGRGYRIGDHVQSDRRRFLADVKSSAEVVDRDPRRALELVGPALTRWRGEPWTGMERPIGVEADRASLLGERTAAIRVRATALIALHRRDAALADLRELLEVDPYDELARYHLVQTLADAGQRAEALLAIQDANRLFARRGLLPDGSLGELEQRLLSADYMSRVEPERLPEHAGEFVGRASEINALADLIRDNRLVTIHGPGGSGKTRLAVEAASTASKASGSSFVALADAQSRRQVELAFARGLGLPANRLDGLDTTQRSAALAHAAASSTLLMVLDNCEHVIDDVRSILADLLAEPGPLRVLATSRVTLELVGEHRYPIPEFSDGVELFLRCSTRNGIPIDSPRHRDAIAAICEQVHRLPLAIEIVAAQTPYRTLEEIAGELDQGIAHRDGTQPHPRHESMDAAIRWSHQLLDDESAKAFVRLGIFDAPFERADALAVIGTNDASTVLDTLVRHSLLERRDRGGHSAYRLAVPVQQYCAAQLAQQETVPDVATGYAEWLLEFTDRPYGDVWWRLSAIDAINLRFSHALSAVGTLRSVGRVNEATRLASRLGGAAHLYGHADELIDTLTELWPNCTDDDTTADALLAVVICADVARRPEYGPTLGLLAAMEGSAGRRHRVFVHCQHSLLHMMAARLTDENYERAHQELQLAREHSSEAASPISRANIEHWESGIRLLEGNWPAAEAAARRALRDSADTVIGVLATSCLAHARLQLGDPDVALELATSHPRRHLDIAFGDRLGLVAAVALIQRGDIEPGLEQISSIQQRANQVPWAAQPDDLAIVVAHIAHLLGHSDLTRQIIDTGVVGFGPWIGYLVPKICQDLHIPLVRRDSHTDGGSLPDIDAVAKVTAKALSDLHDRQGS